VQRSFKRGRYNMTLIEDLPTPYNMSSPCCEKDSAIYFYDR
jgi:hypothetical protein